MNRTRLLIADLDSILVGSDRRLTPRACEAVRALRRSGIRFAVASGRPLRGMLSAMEGVELDEPLVAFNGGQIGCPDLEILEQRVIPEEVADRVLRRLGEWRIEAWLYRGLEWLVTNADSSRVRNEVRRVRFLPRAVRDLSIWLPGALEIVGVSDDRPYLERRERDLREELGSELSALRSQPHHLDVTHPRANRGDALEWFRRRYGLAREEIASIGDLDEDGFVHRLEQAISGMAGAA